MGRNELSLVKYIVLLFVRLCDFFNNVKIFGSWFGEGWWLDLFRVGVLLSGWDRKKKKYESVCSKGMVMIDNEV